MNKPLANNYLALFLLPLLLITSCLKKKTKLEPGIYEGAISMQNQVLNFHFVVGANDPVEIELMNGTERIKLNNLVFNNDSIEIPMHVFDAKIVCSIKNQTLKGYWQKNYESDYKLPFSAILIQNLPPTEPLPQPDFTLESRYKVFFESELKDSNWAVGEFTTNGIQVTGTFLTTTGDYRFLEGNIYGDSLILSTFDGEHAFLFKAVHLPNNELQGEFWSGKKWHESWVAYPDAEAKLRPADGITELKPGVEIFKFNGKNLNGAFLDEISAPFQQRIKLIQVMGTWCPNCLDETMFLSEWYRNHPNDRVKIIGLAFERKADFNYGSERLQTLKERYNVPYELLLAGKKDSATVAEHLPSLLAIKGYPTLICTDESNRVLWIHTGFTGPGTGHHYVEWKNEFELRMNKLLQ